MRILCVGHAIGDPKYRAQQVHGPISMPHGDETRHDCVEPIFAYLQKILRPPRFLSNFYGLRSYTKKLGHVATA